jgi:hypothetical protein
VSYVVVKTVKGRRYRYLQTSWREGKKVRTKAVCLGPADGPSIDPHHERGLAAAERHADQVAKEQRAKWGETAAERSEREKAEGRAAALAELHEQFGMVVPEDNSQPTAEEK